MIIFITGIITKGGLSMLNIYLCDDETVQLSCLKKQIEKYLVDTKKEAVLVSAETNPEKTLKEAKSNPDAPSLFLSMWFLMGTV